MYAPSTFYYLSNHTELYLTGDYMKLRDGYLFFYFIRQ